MGKNDLSIIPSIYDKKPWVLFNATIFIIQQDNLSEKCLLPAFWLIEQKYSFFVKGNYNIYSGLSFIETKPPISNVLLIDVSFTLLSKVQYW